MQYEGQAPFCVYVGYTSQSSLDILTANKLQRESHNRSFSHLRQVDLKQDRKGQENIGKT